MPFTRPTLPTIIDRVEADMESRLGLGRLLRRGVLKVLARVQAGLAHLLHGHLSYIGDQVIIDTAEKVYLERWGSLWSINRKAATFGKGPADFSGTPATVVPAGTELARADAVLYTTDAEVTVGGGGTVTAQVTAKLAGVAGNADAATTLSLSSPIVGITAVVVGTGGIIGGTEEETDAELLARLLQRLRETPQGGAARDYVRWALEVAGVTRAWAFEEHLGAGTVGLTFARDGDASPIPDAGEVQTVQDYIDDVPPATPGTQSRRPVTADLTVFAPVDTPLDPNITLTPSNTTVQAAVQTALEELILREAVPGGTLLISHVREAISLAAGETNHVLVSPVADVVYTSGQLGSLGTITWS